MSSEQRGEQLRKIMQDAHDNTERRLNETGHAGFLVRDNPTLGKPFDLTRLLRHAFDAGKDGGLWVDYDPTELDPYLRIDAVIASVNHASLSQPSAAPEALVEEIEILRAELSQARRHAFIEAAEMAEFLASEEDEEWRSDRGGTIETRLAGARSWAFGRIANILFDKAEKSLTALSTKEPSDA